MRVNVDLRVFLSVLKIFIHLLKNHLKRHVHLLITTRNVTVEGYRRVLHCTQLRFKISMAMDIIN